MYESSFSIMSGQTSYQYQPGTPADAVRAQDSTLNTASFAAQNHEENPNSRTQFDNILSYSKPAWVATTSSRAASSSPGCITTTPGRAEQHVPALQQRQGRSGPGVQHADRTRSTSTKCWASSSRTPGRWNQLTLNLGFRFDHNVGTLPAQSNPGGQFAPAKSIPEQSPIKQNLAVWRTGAVYDPIGDGKTALKASYSRYGLQVGIDRVLNVNPLQSDSQLCTWTDPNNDGIAQPARSAIALATRV